MNLDEIDHEKSSSDIFNLSEIETINATENTLGNAGGAILENLSWVYRFDE